MSQLNPNIILGVQRPRATSPQEMYAQKAQFDQNELAQRMGQMKIQEYEQGRADNALLRDTYKQFGTDTAQNVNSLYRAGLGKQAGEYSELQAKSARERATGDKTKIETVQKVVGLMGSTAYALSQSPTLNIQEVAGAVEQLKSQLPQEYHAALDVSKLPQDPAGLRAALQGIYTKSIETEKLLADQTSRRNNDQTNATSRANNQNTNATTRRGQDMVDARGRESLDIARTKAGTAGPDGRPAKPMPATALKMQNEALDVIGIASSIQADLGTIEQQIAKGKLDFGPVKNLVNNAKNTVGMSDEQSRNLSTFKSSMEKLRNDSLRLNKGVQTDGDAQRAWNELFQNINDKELVKQRLSEIKAINSRAVDLRKREVEDIRNNYNQQQYDFGTQTKVPSAITPPSGGANLDALLEKYK